MLQSHRGAPVVLEQDTPAKPRVGQSGGAGDTPVVLEQGTQVVSQQGTPVTVEQGMRVVSEKGMSTRRCNLWPRVLE